MRKRREWHATIPASFIQRENSSAAHLSDNAYRLIERLVLGTGCVLVASWSIKPRSMAICRGFVTLLDFPQARQKVSCSQSHLRRSITLTHTVVTNHQKFYQREEGGGILKLVEKFRSVFKALSQDSLNANV